MEVCAVVLEWFTDIRLVVCKCREVQSGQDSWFCDGCIGSVRPEQPSPERELDAAATPNILTVASESGNQLAFTDAPISV